MNIGREVHLTQTEFKLVAAPVGYADKVTTQRQFLIEVWGPEDAEWVPSRSAPLRASYVGHPRVIMAGTPIAGTNGHNVCDPATLLFHLPSQ